MKPHRYLEAAPFPAAASSDEAPPPRRRARPHGPESRAALGARAEELVAADLVQRGALLLGRNVRVGRLEIDVLALEGPVVLVVEVRTRGAGSWQGPLASVGPAKQKRIRTAGEALWRSHFSHDARIERMRFDIAAVRFGPDGEASIEYAKAAF